NQEIANTKICQLDTTVEELKPKKKKPKKKKEKGIAMKKLICVIATLVMVWACYGAYVTTDINYDIASNPESLSIYLRDSFANMTSNSYLFTPTDTVPTEVEGKVYYNDTSNVLRLFNGTSWLNIDTAGGVSLDGAYDFGGAGSGRSIGVEDDSITMTTTDADANPVLSITHSGAADGDGILITVSGSSQDAIEIENTGSGYDIEGTSATWYATAGGILVGTSLDATGAAGLTLQNDETITNTTNSEITFLQDGGEDLTFDMDAATNAVGLKSSTGVDELAMGTVDDLTGVGTIVFDQVASSISLAANGADDNLTITVTGAQASSIILTSEGTGADAIDLNTTAGGIDIDLSGGGAGDDHLCAAPRHSVAGVYRSDRRVGADRAVPRPYREFHQWRAVGAD
ncbi:hypothetical protein LCGC14_2839730, partial [marine sediment metagenome]